MSRVGEDQADICMSKTRGARVGLLADPFLSIAGYNNAVIRIAMLSFCLTFLNAAMAVGEERAPIDFDGQVRPLLERACFKCHGPDKQNGGLRFDRRETAFAEGDSGSFAIVAG